MKGKEDGLPILDAHIHLDAYTASERELIWAALDSGEVQGLTAVSMHQASCEELVRLKSRCPERIRCAFGYHPEQPLPSEEETERLIAWIRRQPADLAAIGEVGLPYYLRTAAQESGEESFPLDGYVRLLDRFLQLSTELEVPVVLHAVYEDADTALDLLERRQVRGAHFHWFKGSAETLERMRRLGCRVSVTPDIVYKPATQELVRQYPLELLMAETDGPWPFRGPFQGEMTHPRMIRRSLEQIAALKGIRVEEAAAVLYENARRFYGFPA